MLKVSEVPSFRFFRSGEQVWQYAGANEKILRMTIIDNLQDGEKAIEERERRGGEKEEGRLRSAAAENAVDRISSLLLRVSLNVLFLLLLQCCTTTTRYVLSIIVCVSNLFALAPLLKTF